MHCTAPCTCIGDIAINPDWFVACHMVPHVTQADWHCTAPESYRTHTHTHKLEMCKLARDRLASTDCQHCSPLLLHVIHSKSHTHTPPQMSFIHVLPIRKGRLVSDTFLTRRPRKYSLPKVSVGTNAPYFGKPTSYGLNSHHSTNTNAAKDGGKQCADAAGSLQVLNPGYQGCSSVKNASK